MACLLHALRFVWVVIKLLGISLLVVGLLVISFLLAMDSANVYMIVTDGLKARADVALNQQDESSTLQNYFTGSFLSQDEMLRSLPYQNAVISGYTYHLSVKSLWCHPWDGTATMEVVEAIPEIDGEMNADANGGDGTMPEWQRTHYKVTCVKQDGQWLISGMEVLELMEPEETPTAEPSVTPSPTPEATPTPVPTPTPTGAEATPVPVEPALTGTVTVDRGNVLNVRSGPGTDYDRIGSLENGVTVVILEQEGTWLRIEFEGQEGWVYSKYVQMSESAAP